MRYSAAELLEALRHPLMVSRELHMLSLRANRRFHDRFVTHDGIDVMERDWDDLLILDVCRYDCFADVNCLESPIPECGKPVVHGQPISVSVIFAGVMSALVARSGTRPRDLQEWINR